MSEAAPETSARLEAITQRALAKDRAARYQAAVDFLKDLKREKRRADFAAGLDDSLRPEDAIGQTTAVMHATDSYTTHPLAAHSDPYKTVRATSSAEYIITGIRRHKTAALMTMALYPCSTRFWICCACSVA